MMLVASRLAEMEPDNLALKRVHFWPMADDGDDRDAYVGYAFDPITNSLCIAAHEETGEFTSRILAGAVNIGDALHGRAVAQPRSWPTPPAIVGSTVAGANTYLTRISSYVRDGSFCTVFVNLTTSAFNSEGTLSIENFPFPFAMAEEFMLSTAFTLTAGISGVTVRGIAGENRATLHERLGLSHLTHSEVTDPVTLRMSFTYMIE